MQSTAMTHPSVLDQKGIWMPNLSRMMATGPEIGFKIQV